MSIIVSRNVVVAAIAASLTMACASTRAPASPKDLQRAELSACADVPDAERDHGPFAHRDRIVKVEQVNRVVSPKAPAPPAGVAVYLRAAPGVTEQWLGRVVECNAAHRAVVASDDRSPLSVDDTRIAITPTVDGFRIAITSESPEVARDLVQRGQSLIN